MPDGGPFGPASVVVFGLLAATAWGAADYGGGVASRRAPLFGVVLVSQLVGMVLAAALAVVRGEPSPGGADIAFAALGGALGAVGILSLYGGLAVGRMGVVAPVTGVLAATVPVVVGILLEGVPEPIVLLGIGLAIVAVVLVSLVAGEPGRRSGVELGLLAGVSLGLFTVVITRVDDGLVFGPLTVVRGVNAVVVGGTVLLAAAVATPRPVRLPRSVLPAVIAIGILDMTGNAGLLFAEQTGSLAVAAVLSSLYPVTTVILAAAILRERVTSSHAIGIVLAFMAIGLITAGSA